jgi:hypothetical protein
MIPALSKCPRCGKWYCQCPDDDRSMTGPGVDVDEDPFDWEPCEHYCDDDCGEHCYHEHCFNCGGCRCPGYCDDYQTYNLRPEETGG